VSALAFHNPGTDASLRRTVGWPRVFVPTALAVALHTLLLLTARPTLVGSAAHDAPPAMFVRMILAASAEPENGATRIDPAADPSSSTRSAADGAQPVLRAQPAADTGSTENKTASSREEPAIAAGSSQAPSRGALPNVAAGLPPAPAYLAAGRLDPGPTLLDVIEPVYPEEAKLQEGSVVLRLLINEAGTVDNVGVVRASPPGLFEASALEAFARARFSPGRMFGVPVKSQITIEVMFTPINRGAQVSGRSY
jgi:periplasmic protein TonB